MEVRFGLACHWLFGGALLTKYVTPGEWYDVAGHDVSVSEIDEILRQLSVPLPSPCCLEVMLEQKGNIGRTHCTLVFRTNSWCLWSAFDDTGDYVLLCSGLVLALQKVDFDQGILIWYIIPSPIFYLLHLSRHVYFSDASDIESFKIT